MSGVKGPEASQISLNRYLEQQEDAGAFQEKAQPVDASSCEPGQDIGSSDLTLERDDYVLSLLPATPETYLLWVVYQREARDQDA